MQNTSKIYRASTFSTSLTFSRACKALRKMLDEARQKCPGATPFLFLALNENKQYAIETLLNLNEFKI